MAAFSWLFIVIFKNYEHFVFGKTDARTKPIQTRTQLHPQKFTARYVLSLRPQHQNSTWLQQVSLTTSSTPNSQQSCVSYNLDHNPYTPAFIEPSEKVCFIPLRTTTLKIIPNYRLLPKSKETSKFTGTSTVQYLRTMTIFPLMSQAVSFVQFAAKNLTTIFAYLLLNSARPAPRSHEKGERSWGDWLYCGYSEVRAVEEEE